MRRKLWKISCMLIAICIMTVSQMAMVFAAETTDGVVTLGDGAASITIQGNTGQSLADKEWRLHKLFDAENASGSESIRYMLNEDYGDSLRAVVGAELGKEGEDVTEYEILDYIQSINDNLAEGAGTEQTLEGAYSSYRYFVEKLIDQIHTDGVQGETLIISSVASGNKVVLEGLEYGYYMIEDVTAVNGTSMAASMTMVTTANPSAVLNIKSDYPTVVKKIYEEDQNVGWNDIADYEIGETVPYRFTSNIPNINGYLEYYYAWHDVMDDALTLQTDSVKIQISGSLDGTDKVYTLADSEFKLVTNPGNDDTFQIQISDIKGIVDREFPQFNDNNENEYGQAVTVTYDAVLNEKAAEDTGRPGFENDVRLEYSNNPNLDADEQSADTGFTPWDTVVCFTYQLNGVKVNSKQAVLANAKFKIYRDEACTDLVFDKEYVSDTYGKFVVSGLDSGTYYLKETEAPAGYRPIDEPIVVTITASFPSERNEYNKGDGRTEAILTLSGKAEITTFEDGEENVTNTDLTADSDNGTLAISIVNKIESKLPVTGSYWMPILFAVGGICVYLGARPNKKQHE